MSEENKTNADGAMEDEIYRLMEDLELSLGEGRPGQDAFDPFGPDDGPAMMDGYGIWCEVDEDVSEHTVRTMTRSFQPSENQFVHVDLELPSEEEEGTLLVEIAVDTASGQVEALFDPQTTALFRDGRRLHVAPIRLTRLLGDDYELAPGLTGTLVVTLYRNGAWVGEHKVAIQGPWPPGASGEEAKGPEAVLSAIRGMLGWGAFKNRMEEMAIRCRVDALRNDEGMAENPPRLHTALIGNPGTGKSTAVRLMASLYKALGLLQSDAIVVKRVSELASSGINAENESVLQAVSEAAGRTLVIEEAQGLYRSDKGSTYDTEARIVRALTDALSDPSPREPWMLVLVGETDGMENVLSGYYPELKKYLSAPIYMEDFTPGELTEMCGRLCSERHLVLTESAERKLRMLILHKYNLRGPGFQNALMVHSLFDEEIIPSMYRRVGAMPAPAREDLETVLPEDIPAIGNTAEEALRRLDELVGLESIKTKVRDYLHAVQLANRRMEQGLPTNMPRLHMAFLGNPGTGKTTVAGIIGEVFASWGILSGGRVIRTEKSQMVGQWIGETEQKMRALLGRARGNILFIDEAYQLVEGDGKDYGRIVMNSLLTELGKDNQDMVIILAGYTAPMKRLLESNEGIESRFPNVFNFEDYTTDELMDIARLMIRRQGFTLTDGAAANMREVIREASDRPSPRFGNGRFVSNLIQNEILATLGARTAALPDPTRDDLCTILPEDVVIGKERKEAVFDNVAIDAALRDLDALAGLDGVKKAIHNFVRSARYLHSIGEPYVGKGLLSWRFIGRSGTGKSTVAEIMARILRGMRLIANSHITQIKGERIFNVSEYDCNQVLGEAVKMSCNGLIFIDADDPRFSENRMGYGRSVEQIRLKVKELTVEAGGECALILAELESPTADVAEQLYEAGVYEFDHTLVFRDFTPEELFRILGMCLEKYNVSFSAAAGEHMLSFLKGLQASVGANARTMKLLSRSIYQQVILRESEMDTPPERHTVELSDVETFRSEGKKGKIGF